MFFDNLNIRSRLKKRSLYGGVCIAIPYQRYYDPRTGRYLTPDPIGLDGGINLFTYTENNPINAIDPLGLYESYWYLSIVPGQHMWDQSMTAFESGQYGWGSAYLLGMIGEQVLFALSLGQWNPAQEATQCSFEVAAPNSVSRFSNLINGLSKTEARTLLRSSKLRGITPDQVTKILSRLNKGRIDKVFLKLENKTGNVRLVFERKGRVSGFQRFSYKIDSSGNILRTVQTAFDDAGNIVRQAGGIFFDVK